MENCRLWALYLGEHSVVRDCEMSGNGSGAYVRAGSVVERCFFYENDGANGIYGQENVVVRDCLFTENAYAQGAITLGDNGRVEKCSLYENEARYGIKGGRGSSILDCALRRNVNAGGIGYGIYTGIDGLIQRCVVSTQNNHNGYPTATEGVGVYADDGSAVLNCVVAETRGTGILVRGNALVQGNTSSENGLSNNDSGISCVGQGARLESNHLSGNHIGIRVSGDENLIVKNSAWNNATNYVIAVSNQVGSISSSPVDAGAWDNFSF